MAVRDITLGQYYPGESPIHRLDARTKIICALIYLVSLFVVQSFSAFGLSIVLLAVVVMISRVPFRFISKGLKPIIFLIILTMIINLLFNTSGTVLVEFWKIKITDAGVYRAAFMGLRLVLLIFGSSLLTLTTKPIELTDGLEKLLSPLAKIGLPAHELAMMMTIALRFIPTLLDETDKIMKAFGASVRVRLQDSRRPCHGHGGTLLPRRLRTHQDEPDPLRQGRRHSIHRDDRIRGASYRLQVSSALLKKARPYKTRAHERVACRNERRKGYLASRGYLF